MLLVATRDPPPEVNHFPDGVSVHAIQGGSVDNAPAKVSRAVVLELCPKLLLRKKDKLQEFLVRLKVEYPSYCLQEGQFQRLRLIDDEDDGFIVPLSILQEEPFQPILVVLQ